MIRAEDYFATARERYLIKLRREAGQEAPWTKDLHFQRWRFCNVHREDDRTTIWFRDNIREPMKEQGIDLVKATMIFRWFNRIETGEAIKDLILGKWSSIEAEKRLRDQKSWVTGAYMIRTPEGFDKLTGVLYCIDRAIPQLEKSYRGWHYSLEDAWEDLLGIFGIGPFMAYEIVSDIRWTPLLEEAEDINKWANPGPGCRRGLGRVVANDRKHFSHRLNADGEMKIVMKDLLEMSRDQKYWPFDERPWEMREIEHWACEFEKYCAAQEGRKLKRRFP